MMETPKLACRSVSPGASPSHSEQLASARLHVSPTCRAVGDRQPRHTGEQTSNYVRNHSGHLVMTGPPLTPGLAERVINEWENAAAGQSLPLNRGKRRGGKQRKEIVP